MSGVRLLLEELLDTRADELHGAAAEACARDGEHAPYADVPHGEVIHLPDVHWTVVRDIVPRNADHPPDCQHSQGCASVSGSTSVPDRLDLRVALLSAKGSLFPKTNACDDALDTR